MQQLAFLKLTCNNDPSVRQVVLKAQFCQRGEILNVVLNDRAAQTSSSVNTLGRDMNYSPSNLLAASFPRRCLKV